LNDSVTELFFRSPVGSEGHICDLFVERSSLLENTIPGLWIIAQKRSASQVRRSKHRSLSGQKQYHRVLPEQRSGAFGKHCTTAQRNYAQPGYCQLLSDDIGLYAPELIFTSGLKKLGYHPVPRLKHRVCVYELHFQVFCNTSAKTCFARCHWANKHNRSVWQPTL